MKLTKTNIEQLANEIMGFLDKSGLSNDVNIYFNNKVMRSRGKWDEDFNYIPNWVTEENVDPHDYFEYAAYDHILSMSFEGALYEVLNYTFGKKEEKFRAIFDKYGLYFELGNAWNLSAYPNNDNMEIEYTKYKKPKETIYLYYRNKEEAPAELRMAMEIWYDLAQKVGDKGSCVLGAGFEFEWCGDKYFMYACSPYQGSISWETPKDKIESILKDLGVRNIHYHWGNMD